MESRQLREVFVLSVVCEIVSLTLYPLINLSVISWLFSLIPLLSLLMIFVDGGGSPPPYFPSPIPTVLDLRNVDPYKSLSEGFRPLTVVDDNSSTYRKRPPTTVLSSVCLRCLREREAVTRSKEIPGNVVSDCPVPTVSVSHQMFRIGVEESQIRVDIFHIDSLWSCECSLVERNWQQVGTQSPVDSRYFPFPTFLVVSIVMIGSGNKRSR